MKKLVNLLIVLLLLMAGPPAALAQSQKAGPAASSPRLPPGTYSVSQARYVAQVLTERLGIDPAKMSDLLHNLNEAVQDPWFRREVKYKPINGVFVFEAGRGGLIVEFMDGRGLVSFAGGPQASPIHLRSWSVGAQAGGKALWGVGLIIGLERVGYFGGDYSGKTQSATAGDATPSNWVVLSQSGGSQVHEIYLIQSGRGLSAGVALEKLTINPDRRR